MTVASNFGTVVLSLLRYVAHGETSIENYSSRRHELGFAEKTTFLAEFLTLVAISLFVSAIFNVSGCTRMRIGLFCGFIPFTTSSLRPVISQGTIHINWKFFVLNLYASVDVHNQICSIVIVQYGCDGNSRHRIGRRMTILLSEEQLAKAPLFCSFPPRPFFSLGL